MSISFLAGNPAPPSMLINVLKLVTAYCEEQPDPAVTVERVAFGTPRTMDNRWFAARLSGTEDAYKLYAKRFHDREHPVRIQGQARALVVAP